MYSLLSLVLVFLLVEAGAESVLKQRRDDECNAITSNINPILEPCTVSARQCLEAPEIGSISDIQGLICNPRAENIRSTLVRCEGLLYADQVYGGVCGDMENTSISCVDAVQTVNDGQEAKDACCGEASGSGSDCGRELKRLSREMGCCTGTVVFQFFFADCAGGLDALFNANGLEVPPLCKHLFSDGMGLGIVSSTPWTEAVAVAVVVAYSVVHILS